MCLRLRKLRDNAGWSQQEVADRLYISQAAYSRLEKGEIEMTLSRLLRIREIYNVPLTELIQGL